jgi:hypothetical protein
LVASARAALGRAALTATGGPVAVALVEMLLRALADVPPCDEALDKRFRQTIPGVKAAVRYQRDALGLRRGGTVGSGARLWLLCLGASTTDQATQNWEDTWCGLVASGLHDALRPLGIAVEAAAYGRGAMTAADAADELERLEAINIESSQSGWPRPANRCTRSLVGRDASPPSRPGGPLHRQPADRVSCAGVQIAYK